MAEFNLVTTYSFPTWFTWFYYFVQKVWGDLGSEGRRELEKEALQGEPWSSCLLSQTMGNLAKNLPMPTTAHRLVIRIMDLVTGMSLAQPLKNCASECKSASSHKTVHRYGFHGIVCSSQSWGVSSKDWYACIVWGRPVLDPWDPLSTAGCNSQTQGKRQQNKKF